MSQQKIRHVTAQKIYRFMDRILHRLHSKIHSVIMSFTSSYGKY